MQVKRETMDFPQLNSPQQEVEIKTESPDLSPGEEENVGENWADVSIKSEIDMSLDTNVCSCMKESKDQIDPLAVNTSLETKDCSCLEESKDQIDPSETKSSLEMKDSSPLKESKDYIDPFSKIFKTSTKFVKLIKLEALKTEDDAHNAETDNGGVATGTFLNSDEQGQQAGTGQETQNCLSTTELKTLLDDDTFRQLERHFLMTGRGRRPDLPHVETITNRLLLQLYFLKQKSGSTRAMLRSWLVVMDPTLSVLMEGRLYSKLCNTLDKCTKLNKEEVLMFLEKPHNFLAVAEPLASLGLTRSHLLGLEEYRAPSESTTITNEVVVALERFRNKEKSPHTVVRKLILTLCNESTGLKKCTLDYRLKKSLKKYRQLSAGRKEKQLQDFLKEEFDVHEPVKPKSVTVTCAYCIIKESELKRKEDILKILEKKKSSQESFIQELTTQAEINRQVIQELQEEKFSLFQELESIKKSKQYTSNNDLRRRLKESEDEKDALLKQLNIFKRKSELLNKQVNTVKKQKTI